MNPTSINLTEGKDSSILEGVPIADVDITRAKKSARRHKGQAGMMVLPQTAEKSTKDDHEVVGTFEAGQ